MKFEELYDIAVIWTCYLEHFPEPERYLNIYGLNHDDVLKFDRLGSFFPFEEFYVRCPGCEMAGARENLMSSKKTFILPWIYWPRGSSDSLYGKQIISPSAEMFTLLDNKVETKKIFAMLGLPTPKWSFVNNGKKMLEKPIENSAGGLGLSLTENNPEAGFFLEEYIPGHRSVGLQFFVYKEVEFICADEMLFHNDEQQTFTFHEQKNVQQDELPASLIEGCYKLAEYASSNGYKGFFGIDALVRNEGYFFLEINPRGIAFLPAYFAATARGWNSFKTYSKSEALEKGELLLLDFGRLRKVVKELS